MSTVLTAAALRLGTAALLLAPPTWDRVLPLLPTDLLTAPGHLVWLLETLPTDDIPAGELPLADPLWVGPGEDCPTDDCAGTGERE
ncbi:MULTISPECIES: hypothetical protein [Deinococcus]|uniref:Secreted protein n=1 Tax=Deinococcus daejeonensis TaxID=1007098 RepID=A0ABQ2J7C3_9DEIO|nr:MULTISPECIES: hypothetical protein [Deinococcus]RIY15304.1 hypothetical protein D3W47_03335 [Deinococcus sp. RM]GGN38981.1 hypothetical protein GCM10010842_22340 [Deinococcus daejeonensis]